MGKRIYDWGRIRPYIETRLYELRYQQNAKEILAKELGIKYTTFLKYIRTHSNEFAGYEWHDI